MKMTHVLIAFAAMAAAPMALAASFTCGNPPETKWGSYYCVSGEMPRPGEITDVEFGTCVGSKEAEEEEPENQVSNLSARHDPKLAATSAQWRGAMAFNLTTREHGPATLYMKTKGTPAVEFETARLKVAGKDLRLECVFNN